jgi:tRNA-splicing ligase RtcB (3'-phosphate/5'-hydroxy nucleic acid ligase)
MGKLKLRGKDLRAIGYPEGPVISIAMNIMEKNYKFEKEDEVIIRRTGSDRPPERRYPRG